METPQLLSLLPALLGFAGFIVHLLWTANKPPSQVLLEILAIIRARNGAFPPLDGRLSGEQVFRILEKQPEFRDALSDREFKLLEGIRTTEHNERVVALVIVAILVVVSVVAYLYESTHKQLTPITTVGLSGEVAEKAETTNEFAYINQIKPVIAGLLANGSTGFSDALGKGINWSVKVPGTTEDSINNIVAYIGPNSPLKPDTLNLAISEEEASVMSMLLVTIKFFKVAPPSSIDGIMNTAADCEMAMSLLHSPGFKYMLLGIDFQKLLISQKFDNVRPDSISRSASVANWEDLIGMTMYVNVISPMHSDLAALTLSSNTQTEFVVLPDEFTRLSLINRGGAKVVFYKTVLTRAMRNRLGRVRVADVF